MTKDEKLALIDYVDAAIGAALDNKPSDRLIARERFLADSLTLSDGMIFDPQRNVMATFKNGQPTYVMDDALPGFR